MTTLILGLSLLLAQLPAPGNALPQVLTPEFKTAPVKVGATEVVVRFKLRDGFGINRTPPITLKVTEPSGLKIEKKEFETPETDPKAKDEYYVDLPEIRVPVTVLKAGTYSIPAKFSYFFCSKKDGFCSKQSYDIKIPLRAE
jgi:hypothetical protein